MIIDRKRPYCVYEIKCNINNKVYYGKTKNYRTRIQSHMSGKGCNADLSRDIKQYGAHNFTYNVVKKDLTNTESLLIESILCTKTVKQDPLRLYTNNWDFRLLKNHLNTNNVRLEDLEI